MSKRILCIDDDLDSLDLTCYLLRMEGFDVVSANSGGAGMPLVKSGGLAAIVLDNVMSGRSGIAVCRQIRTYNDRIPIVFFSGAARRTDREAGLAAGAQEYLIKPDDLELLAIVVAGLVNFQNC